MRKFLSLAFIGAFALLAGCGANTNNPSPSPNPNTGFSARFAFSNTGYILPFPNDFFFLNSTNGLVSIPGIPNPTDYSNPLAAINTLDGFSTTAPITEHFTAPIDPKSLIGNKTVFVFKVTTDPTKGFAVVGVQGLLTPGTDYTLGVSPDDPSVLSITPTTALAPASSYMVVLTRGIQSTTGAAATPSAEFQQVEASLAGQGSISNPALAQVAPLIGAMLQASTQATGGQVTANDVVLAWTLTTQTIGTSLTALAKQMQPAPIELAPTGMTTHTINSQLPGYAEIYAGTITIPYYLGIPSASDPGAPLTDFWHGKNGSLLTPANPLPVATGTVTIPVLMTIPAPNSPYFQNGGTYPLATGWPVVVFQHGITRNRLDMLAVADTFAQAGYAMIAIDLPLHGITDTTNPFYENQLFKGTPYAGLVTGERTFNLPPGLFTGAPTTGIASSGSYFINLGYLLTSRDNLRESEADLLQLTESLPGASFKVQTSVGGVITTLTEKFNAQDTYFVGHSLGAISGIPYLAEVTNLPGYGSSIDVRSATLGNPGGKIAYLLQQSPTFAPEINAGLAQKGIVPGTQPYADFFQWTQTIVDAGDPINYGALAAKNTPIDLLEVVGDPATQNPPDQVVPNSATNLLVNVMGLTQYGASTINPKGLRAVTRFLAGDHGSLLDPTSSLTVTQQMQLQMGVFAYGCLPGVVPGCPTTGGPPNGQTLDIAFPSVVQQP